MSRYMAVLGLVTPQIVNLKRFLCDRLLFASNARISSPGGPSDANSSNNRTQRPGVRRYRYPRASVLAGRLEILFRVCLILLRATCTHRGSFTGFIRGLFRFRPLYHPPLDAVGSYAPALLHSCVGSHGRDLVTVAPVGAEQFKERFDFTSGLSERV